jgi:hypothetical protein
LILFSEPIIANVSCSDNVYSCKNEELGIVSISRSLEECIQDFEDEILFLWKEYGQEDNSKLTNDAIELKEKILRHMKR